MDNLQRSIRTVRLGYGANCSSLGSVVDVLFATAAVGTALMAAVAASLRSGNHTHRSESWGAWVRIDDPPALVALDHEGTRSLHLACSEAPQTSAPLEVHLAVTARCPVGCPTCYLDATPDGFAPPLAALLDRLDRIAQARVFTVAFGGGEPLTRDDLPLLAEHAHALGLVAVMTTSGYGLTRARAVSLTPFAQVNVTLDGTLSSEQALRTLVDAGVRTGANVVLTRHAWQVLEHLTARAKELGACEVQLLRYKAAGRGAVHNAEMRLLHAQVAELPETLRELSMRFASPSFRLRIDCALVPFVDVALAPGALRKFGILGCEAGKALAAVDVLGRQIPCSVPDPECFKA
ncbi:MAG: radical SAM protein [Myxococcales bacterium]